MPAPGSEIARRVLVASEEPALRALARTALATLPCLQVVEVGDPAGWDDACAGADLVVLGPDWRRGVGHAARSAGSHLEPWVIAVVAADGRGEDAVADDVLFEPFGVAEVAFRAQAGLRAREARRAGLERTAHLEQLVDRQSEFLSVVSHEIRTPLSAIMSSANILMRYATQRPESVERFSTVIYQEGRRLTRLINNLLDLAKIEAGQVEWTFAPVHPDELLRQVGESFEALVGERNLSLELVGCPAAPVIRADRDKMIQVLVNLVFNAIKHSPDGARVFLRCLPAGGGARIEVEDEGPGIPEGFEEQVFERFRQADSGANRLGTGLGLTISRTIVEQHGGRIWAVAGRSAGALLVVELPAADAEGHADGPV